jgi:hypothetical protein
MGVPILAIIFPLQDRSGDLAAGAVAPGNAERHPALEGREYFGHIPMREAGAEQYRVYFFLFI